VGHGHALQHVLAGFVLAAVTQGQIKVVQRGQQVAKDLLRRVTHLLFMLAREAFLEIVHLCGGAQAHFVQLGLAALFGALFGCRVVGGGFVVRCVGSIFARVLPKQNAVFFKKTIFRLFGLALCPLVGVAALLSVWMVYFMTLHASS